MTQTDIRDPIIKQKAPDSAGALVVIRHRSDDHFALT
jgi:hypothetical protein